MGETIVMYTIPSRGHLIPTIQLAKQILSQKPSLTINIILPNPPISLNSNTTTIISTTSTTIPSIKFHHLPTITIDPSSYTSHRAILFHHFQLITPHFQTLLTSLTGEFTVRCLILDFFCFPAMEVASQLNIPAFHFFTSAATVLSMFLHLPEIFKTRDGDFKELHSVFFDLPCISSVPLSHLTESLLVRDTPECSFIQDCATHLTKSAGIIVNTFESLEPKAITEFKSSSKNSFCVPPVYCVGPLIEPIDETKHECLTWLDSQPSKSVVFVNFGTLGSLSNQQLEQLGLGLEKSGCRFLWVLKNPNPNNPNQPDPDLDSLLPDGFLHRTRDRGLVVKSWAPQVAVLSHDSVGGFLTHCGWNSVLESIRFGVPMICWPLYAEQKFNKVLLVKEMEVALALAVAVVSENGELVVSGDDVEERVRELMESEKGELIRKRVNEKRVEASEAVSRNGTSRVGLAELVETLVSGHAHAHA